MRLQQILALKFLGFSLDEVKAFLAAGPSRLREVLHQQKAMMREKRAQLDAIVTAIEAGFRRTSARPLAITQVLWHSRSVGRRCPNTDKGVPRGASAG